MWLSLCDYSDVYTIFKRTVTVDRSGANGAARQGDERDKEVIFKNCAPFKDCLKETIHK